MNTKAKLKVYLASPRGFCAGVDRAIDMVELALMVYGQPIYVKHEIVHNKTVVDDLSKKGVIFVDTVEEVPANSVVIFSAHGSAPDEFQKALNLGLRVLDATCPLVTKVHLEAIRYFKEGKHIIYVGHRNHPEPRGVMGEIDKEKITLIETVEEAMEITPIDPNNLALLTQTTLSIAETEKIVEILKNRFPTIVLPPARDICYATTNRQLAVSKIAPLTDVFIVLGSQTSSNSSRLRDLAETLGATALLVDSIKQVDKTMFAKAKSVGLSAGASAPEKLVDEALDFFRENFNAEIEEVDAIKENIIFTLPSDLKKSAAFEKDAAPILDKYR